MNSYYDLIKFEDGYWKIKRTSETPDYMHYLKMESLTIAEVAVMLFFDGNVDNRKDFMWKFKMILTIMKINSKYSRN